MKMPEASGFHKLCWENIHDLTRSFRPVEARRQDTSHHDDQYLSKHVCFYYSACTMRHRLLKGRRKFFEQSVQVMVLFRRSFTVSFQFSFKRPLFVVLKDDVP